MTRWSFGLSPAQSTSLFCLEKMIMDNITKASEKTVNTALGAFYVDDGLVSFSSAEELIVFYKELVPLLASHGFPITKFLYKL